MTDQPISFDEAPALSGPVTCSRCGRDLQQYWAVNGAVLCESCKDIVVAEEGQTGGGVGPFLKATLFGVGGMLVGATAWAAVEWFAGYQLSLIAILLGFLVGKGIHKGSGNRGGLRYQLLALALTWVGYGLASTPSQVRYLFEEQRVAADSAFVGDTLGAPDSAASPDSLMPITAMSDSALDQELASLDSAIAKGKSLESEAEPMGIGAVLGAIGLFIITLPALAVFEGGSAILAIIYAIGLYYAWKHSMATEQAVSGPHPVGGGAPA